MVAVVVVDNVVHIKEVTTGAGAAMIGTPTVTGARAAEIGVAAAGEIVAGALSVETGGVAVDFMVEEPMFIQFPS